VIEIYVNYFSATLSPMKNLKLLAAITVACSALISGLQAAPITYSIVDNAAYQNGYTVSGNITTDGSIGALSKSNITSWNFVITNTATSTFVASASGTEATGADRLQASATQLTLPPVAGVSSFTQSFLSFRQGGSGMLLWNRLRYNSESGSEGYLGQNSSGNVWVTGGDNTTVDLQSTAGGDWIIGTAAAAVPEPSTYGLLFGGFTLAVVAMRRRTSKQA